MPSSSIRNDYRQEPTYWFAVLEIAREQRDIAREDEAIRQLQRLGVRISYDAPRQTGGRP